MNTIPVEQSYRTFQADSNGVPIDGALVYAFINYGNSTVLLDDNIQLLPAPPGVQPVPFQFGVDSPYVFRTTCKIRFQGGTTNNLVLVETKIKKC
jgi:hypothetical protein